MRIAIPLTNGEFAQHFGHCEQFALLDIDPASRSIHTTTHVDAPEHEPGLLPRWLDEQGVTVVIAGNMGSRAQALFNKNKIEIRLGVQPAPVAVIASQYLDGTLVTGPSTCDH